MRIQIVPVSKKNTNVRERTPTHSQHSKAKVFEAFLLVMCSNGQQCSNTISVQPRKACQRGGVVWIRSIILSIIMFGQNPKSRLAIQVINPIIKDVGVNNLGTYVPMGTSKCLAFAVGVDRPRF